MTSTNNDKLWTVISDDEIFKRRHFACGVYQDRYIVIAGGCQEINTELQSTAIYDVVTQTCIALPDLPFASRYHGVVLNDYFYVTDLYSELHRICLSRRMRWEFVAKQQGFRRIEGMVTDGSRIFLIDWNSQITCLEPSTNEFFPIKGSTHAMRRVDFSTVVIDDKIYMMGGRTMDGEPNDQATEKITVFDIVNKSWNETQPLPTSLANFTALSIDRWIVVTGSKLESDSSRSKGFIYDTHTKMWREANVALSSPRWGHRCVNLGSQIITLGGFYQNFDYCPMTAIHIQHIPDLIWMMLKPYILLRQLIHDGRAAPIVVTNTKKNTNADVIVEKVFTDMPLDIFRNILLFLK